jgi:hypothetical protein
VVRQALALQVEGAQPIATPTRQVPSPSQTLAGTSRSAPSHADTLQMVPAW